MHHPADVALVDAHAEGNGGANHLHLSVGEKRLRFLALGGCEPGMVYCGADAEAIELFVGRLGIFAREGVDDAGVVGVAASQPLHGLYLLA